MSVENFYTVQNYVHNDAHSNSSKAGAGHISVVDDQDTSGNKPSNFLDIILANVAKLDDNDSNLEPSANTNINANIDAQGDNTDLDAIIAKIEGLLPEGESIENFDITALIANNPEIEQDVIHFIEATQLGDDSALHQTLMLNKIAIDDILKPLENNKELKAQINDLIMSGEEDIAPELAKLLGLNLTPAQLAALDQKIGTLQSFIETPLLNNTLSQDMAARLKALHSSNSLQDDLADDQIQKYLNSNFKGILKEVNANDNASKGGTHMAMQDNGTLSGLTQQQGHASSALQGWPFSLDGSLFSPMDAGLDAHLEQLSQGALPSSPNAMQMGSLSSLITQAHGATHTHPGTQMVAVNIQKAVSNGENTDLRLQLDPPELGRVEVKLSFGADKVLKASMVVEKPETYMMLQRDVQVLEKALQEMGLESDGGIDFQLAEQGFDFEQNNKRGGGHDHGGTGASGDAESDEIIESTMTWHVDPESGHMRYDIFV